jgi:threonine/homoserine/homoserine lactone efflux protein
MILDLIVIGLAISLEPVPLTAFILVLASKNGTRKGAAFVSGWVLSLVLVITVTLFATGNSPPKSNTAPSLAALAVRIAIGVVLVLIGLRKYQSMSKPRRPKKTPRWQTGIDNMSAFYALGLATLVQPWGLIAAGAATVVEAKLTSWQDYVVIIFFCLLATGPYLGLELYAALRPDQTRDFLGRLRNWIDTHTDVLIIWVSWIVGLWLIGNNIYLLVT